MNKAPDERLELMGDLILGGCVAGGCVAGGCVAGGVPAYLRSF